MASITAEQQAEHLRIPDLRIAQVFFEITNGQDTEENKQKLIDAIDKNKMSVWYEYLVEKGHLPENRQKLKDLQTSVAEQIKKFDEKIETAEKEEGDSEVRDAMMDKAEFYVKIGDRVNAIKEFRLIRRKCHTTIGFRLDLIFHQLRLALFYSDNFKEEIPPLEENEVEDKESKNDDSKKKKDGGEKIKEKIMTNPHDFAQNLAEAKRLVEEGGDWDRRNRLKVYEAIHYVQVREFQKAAELFLGAVPTFTSYELMSYEDLVSYTIITSLVSIPRKQIRKDLIEGSDIQQQLYTLPEIRQYLTSFYNCQYDQFFISLSQLETALKNNRYFSRHTQFYIREMRLAGYKQLLASYSSLSITYMANSFGVTEEFIDSELSRFIASGRLSAKIDHVAGIVVTNRPDLKNQQYRKVIKQGDHLLNRVQKLSRVINI